MDCPVCKNAMITLELADIEIDHCVGCGGIWLDKGELELLLANPDEAKNLLSSFEAAPSCQENLRKCPICSRKMLKALVGNSGRPVLIDKCSKGDGLWFDKGELQNIFDKAQLDRDNKIKKLLADVFGSR